MVEEVEAAINPDTGVKDGLVFLGICWPLTGLRQVCGHFVEIKSEKTQLLVLTSLLCHIIAMS